MLVRTVAAWGLLLGLAVLNGAFREAYLSPRPGRGVANALSTVSLSLLILLAGLAITSWIAPRTIQDAWTIGVVWLALTLAFEFLAGHFIFGRAWSELLGEYNLLAGKVWLMVLVVTLMTPVVAFTRRGV